jgi:hypothetical protein
MTRPEEAVGAAHAAAAAAAGAAITPTTWEA